MATSGTLVTKRISAWRKPEWQKYLRGTAMNYAALPWARKKREDAITHNNNGKKIQYKINHRPSQRKNQHCTFQRPNQTARVGEILGSRKG